MSFLKIAEDISDSYENIVNEKSFIEHLDTDDSAYMHWDTYYIPSTVFRFYVHNELDPETDIGFIAMSAEIDPDYMNHPDFRQGKPDAHSFEYNLKKYDNSDKEKNRVYDELEKGFKKQLEIGKEEAIRCLKAIEKDLNKNQSMAERSDIIIDKHVWAVQEWIKIDETVKFSGLDMSEIPLTLEAFNLNEDERFLPQAVKDIFIF